MKRVLTAALLALSLALGALSSAPLGAQVLHGPVYHPAAGGSTFTYLGHAKGTGANGGAPSMDTSGANLIVIGVIYDSGGGVSISTSDLSDPKSNSWSQGTNYGSNGSIKARFLYTTPSSVGAGHTITITKTNCFCVVMMAAFSGAASSSPFDLENGAAYSSASTAQPGGITPSADNYLALTLISGDTGLTSSVTISPTGPGYVITDAQSTVGGANWSGALAYVIQTTAALTNPTWGNMSGASGNTAQASFKVGP